MLGKDYQVCKRCVMDTTAQDITFNELGNCNFCEEFLNRSSKILWKSPEQRQTELDALINKVKADGKNKSYDCVVGISGGVDSSWVLAKTMEMGLRPLAVHMDNGWNSELAQNNIANLVQGLKIDLHTHVVYWNEYRGLMQAFFDSDVVDIEMLYDNALLGVNYQTAAKYGIKYIFAGTNQATEGMMMPRGWNWFKYDAKNIKSIVKQFKGPKIKSFPLVGTYDFIMNTMVRKIKWISFPDYFDYNKNEVLKLLQEQHGYRPYPYKHYESVFTRFFQGYLLPKKFNVDKRKLHLSTLVAAGQLSREEALETLKGIPYHSEAALEEDKKYFLKKMGWSSEQLEAYLARPPKPHSDYPSERNRWLNLVAVYKKIFKRKSA